ncbi:MAG: mevalonate kinase [Planctomycetaceae bacterium]
MEIIRKRAYARAGLVGNPSDGYHGQTISILVRNFYAEVVLYEWERIELLLNRDDQSRFGSLQELVQDVKHHGYYDGIRLIKATIKRFCEFCGKRKAEGLRGFTLHDRTFSLRYTTNIPRQVGLAGSSAIVVATLRALMEFYNIRIPDEVLPSLALSVETVDLKIPGGLQDRVIQVYGGLVAMDFAEPMRKQFDYDYGKYERLDSALLPPLYLAFGAERGLPTESLHGPLRDRFDQQDPEVLSAMLTFARYAVEARQAILDQDAVRLAGLIDANFNLRDQVCDVSPSHRDMVHAARSVGATAKFAGSGGAIIGTYQDESMYARLEDALQKIGCKVVHPIIGAAE